MTPNGKFTYEDFMDILVGHSSGMCGMMERGTAKEIAARCNELIASMPVAQVTEERLSSIRFQLGAIGNDELHFTDITANDVGALLVECEKLREQKRLLFEENGRLLQEKEKK